MLDMTPFSSSYSASNLSSARHESRTIANGVIRNGAIILSFASAILFPWPLTAFLALALALFEPFMPLALGIFADTLYYSHQGTLLPLATLFGALGSALAFFVRSRLKTRIM